MKYPTLKYATVILILISLASLTYIFSPANSQTRERTVTNNANSEASNAGGTPALPANAGRMPALPGALPAEVVKVNVDLVTVDALVLHKQTARVVGDLNKDDFILFEDGTKQEITHFSQNALPLSVLLLIDRGGCLDPFGTHVRRAALDAISRLKGADEVAVMSYHSTVELLQPFTRDRSLIADALDRVPPHDEGANHCLNKVFAEAADYIQKAGNPIGRRVIIAITGVTHNFDCPGGPSGKSASQAIYESGAVVCGIIPKTGEQKLENGIMIFATRMGGLAGARSLNIEKLAEETGGEVLQDKPENLDTTFNTLIEHLRTRYSVAFVSSNKQRDGGMRKLKIDIAPATQKSRGKLVVKSRRSYVAPKGP